MNAHTLTPAELPDRVTIEVVSGQNISAYAVDHLDRLVLLPTGQRMPAAQPYRKRRTRLELRVN